MSQNPLRNWQLDPSTVRTVGHDIQHPECVIAERSGNLWVADMRGVLRVRADGSQELLKQNPAPSPGCMPNGMAISADGHFLVADIGLGRLLETRLNGDTRTLHDAVDGQPIGKVNFVMRDSRNRLWITISTRVDPVFAAVRPGLADGYIALADEHGIRIVADGFHFANELRLDAREEWLYVVETTALRISRLRVSPDGSLSAREIFGPSTLGPGFPDGITFDSAGNLWCAIAMADRLVALTPGGEVLPLHTDGNQAAAVEVENHFLAGTLTPEIMMRAPGKMAPGMASVAFGGPELRTVYVGSSMGSTIPYFESPVAGLPLAHHGFAR